MGMGDVSGFEKKKKRIRKHTIRLPLPKENQIIFLTGAWARENSYKVRPHKSSHFICKWKSEGVFYLTNAA
jgi:hypothetical protein